MTRETSQVRDDQIRAADVLVLVDSDVPDWQQLLWSTAIDDGSGNSSTMKIVEIPVDSRDSRPDRGCSRAGEQDQGRHEAQLIWCHWHLSEVAYIRVVAFVCDTFRRQNCDTYMQRALASGESSPPAFSAQLLMALRSIEPASHSITPLHPPRET